MEWRTTEVRWFFAGPCPEAIAQWFHGGVLVGGPEARTDEYAQLHRDDLGIKRRSGHLLDLKVRTAQLPGAGLPPGLDGRLEAWAKWSFALDPTASAPSAWLPVEKRRWTRRYEIIEGDSRPIALDQLVAVGCAAELAFLRVASHEAWSFGFEAFNTEGEALAPLTIGVRAFVAETPLGSIRFDARDSCGYPHWLKRFE